MVERLFVNRPARDLIFGYNDPVLSSLSGELAKLKISFSPWWGGFTGNESFAEAQKQEVFDEYYTGEDDVTLVRSYYKHDSNEYLMTPQPPTGEIKMGWGTPSSSRVCGFDGLQFAPNPPRNGIVPLWFSEIWREVPIENTGGRTTTNHGITLWRYVIPPRILYNSTGNPDNIPYYANGANGFFNLTSVSPSNVPIFASKPHFLDVDPSYTLVGGMTPNREAHDSYFDIEPATGIAFGVRKRIQININVGPVKVFGGEWFPLVNGHMNLPAIWIDGGGDIPDDSAHLFKSQVYLAQGVRDGLQYGGAIFGFIVLLVAAFFFSAAIRRAKSHSN